MTTERVSPWLNMTRWVQAYPYKGRYPQPQSWVERSTQQGLYCYLTQSGTLRVSTTISGHRPTPLKLTQYQLRVSGHVRPVCLVHFLNHTRVLYTAQYTPAKTAPHGGKAPGPEQIYIQSAFSRGASSYLKINCYIFTYGVLTHGFPIKLWIVPWLHLHTNCCLCVFIVIICSSYHSHLNIATKLPRIKHLSDLNSHSTYGGYLGHFCTEVYSCDFIMAQ